MSDLRTAIILGVTADIGRGLSERLIGDGWNVVGLGRTLDRLQAVNRSPALDVYRCELMDKGALAALVATLRTKGLRWDLLVSSVGTMEPIGRFFDIDFDAWERSISVNFTGQMRAIHALWPLRRPERIVDIMLLAGGGTNSPFRNYSAYCVSKIALIKMCELIDDETPDANAFIIGPGYTHTRIHQETLRAGPKAAGEEYNKVLALLEKEGTTIDDIYAHMRWCMAQGRGVAGGRNFSTVHDPWRGGGAALAETLRRAPGAYRLRRQQP